MPPASELPADQQVTAPYNTAPQQAPYAGAPHPYATAAQHPSSTPPYPAAPGQPWGYQAPPPEPPRRSSHLGVIIGSIIGGIALLCVTFAGGAAVGWWLGSHHGGSYITVHGPGFGDDDMPPGWNQGPDDRRGQNGDNGGNGQDDQNGQNDQNDN